MAQTSPRDSSKVLETLLKRKENSLCFDCREKGTTFVNVTLGTFVCTMCAGLLIELNFSVKGLGVSILKDKELATVEEMGNQNARKIWLAKFDDIKGFYPNPKDMLAMQEHFQEKYILKRFYADKTKTDISTKNTRDNSFLSVKSCEVKKTHSVTSGNNSMNNSVFTETDFKFDCNSEKPSSFKKMPSEAIRSPLKIETRQENSFKNPPLTSRKSENNITCSKFAPVNIPQTTTAGNKMFDFTRCNTSESVSDSTTVQHTVPLTNIPQVNQVNNKNFTFTHDFTKSVKVMDTLNNLYNGYTPEKKVDPLDKLFYQYNFSSGNHMRMNANSNPVQNQNFNPNQPVLYYNNQPVYTNNSQLDSIYGLNSRY